MNAKIRRQLDKRKRRIQRRLDKSRLGNCDRPMFTARNIHYAIADRTSAAWPMEASAAFHLLSADAIGLIDAIDDQLHLLKIHLPYHESDQCAQLGLQRAVRWHLSAGSGIVRRQDEEVYLDALGARRIPDPTHGRRFLPPFSGRRRTHADPTSATRSGSALGARQPTAFFEQATLDMDGTLVATTGRMQSRHGYRLRRHLGLPSARRLAGEHR